MSASSPEYAHGPRRFKKHKVLPRPLDHRPLHEPRTMPMIMGENDVVAASSTSRPSSKHEAWKAGNRPHLPPTPPNNFRQSPGDATGTTSASSAIDSGSDTTPHAAKRSVATPPDQRSPPTPDVTPPGPAARSSGSRSSTLNRGQSRFAASDSLTKSFKTAREEASSSDEEGARLAVGHALGSVSVPQRATMRLANSQSGPTMHPRDLDIALNRLQLRQPDAQPARSRQAYVNFSRGFRAPVDSDRQRDKGSERATAHQDGLAVLHRAHTVKSNTRSRTVDAKSASPGAPANVDRSMSLRQLPVSVSPPKRLADHTASAGRPASTSSKVTVPSAVETKRLSGQSVKSNPSTVVEAILVDRPPQRQRTLRHVANRGSLREATALRLSLTDQNIDKLSYAKSGSLDQVHESASRRNSYGSSTPTSIASGRARRQVWKDGGIPVVVVPDRRSSSNSRSRQRHSLRSTSSRRSRRAASPDSSPERSPTRNTPPVVEPQRGRRRPETQHIASEQRTIDFPPTPPARSSSFSVRLSREGSGLLPPSTEENSMPVPVPAQHPQVEGTRGVESPILERGPSPPTEKDGHFAGFIRFDDDKHVETREMMSLGRHDDTLSSKKFSSRNTPFSIASFETSGTAPEVSEAMAVHMYPHQNSSVVMVDHLPRPVNLEQANGGGKTDKLLNQPIIRTTSPGGGPVTPPRQDSGDGLDSPLCNPRPPPPPPEQAPAINLIPATPSGLTPAQEKLVQLGNYFEASEDAPPRRPSMMRRAFGGRRHSVAHPPSAARAPSFLTRTLSLSRNGRRVPSQATQSANPDADPAYPSKGAAPAEEDKLHPFWQPHPTEHGFTPLDGHYGSGHGHRAECYSSTDPWARYPKRSLSSRMKRTFAIFPVRNDDDYMARAHGPDRRVIRRTPSGNLRVVSRRSSIDSPLLHDGARNSPQPNCRETESRSFWRRPSLRRSASRRQMRRSTSWSRWEAMQRLPHILSERRRQKRSQELRQMISGPKDVRDGVQELIERRGTRLQQPVEAYSLI